MVYSKALAENDQKPNQLAKAKGFLTLCNKFAKQDEE